MLFISNSKHDFDDNFFVIDSLKIEKIESKLSGYAIFNNEIIDNNDIINKNVEVDGNGVYTYIEKKDDSIIISQDFTGCWGLYIYENENHFVISNSFLKLVDYLKYDHDLTFNMECAESLIFTEMCTYSYDETLVNEIKLIPRNVQIIIDNNNNLHLKKIDYEENTVNIDSKSGMEILDNWFYKWVNIIRHLYEKTNTLIFDLTGGFDTRIVAALWLSSNIDLNKVTIFSKYNDQPTVYDDFEIACEIAKKFNFELTSNLDNYLIKYDEIYTPFINHFNIKLGNNTGIYFENGYYPQNVYSLIGYGGEIVRGYPPYSKNQVISAKLNKVAIIDSNFIKSTESTINNAFNRIAEDNNVDVKLDEIVKFHYRETRNRYLYGKSAIEQYSINKIPLMPLLDTDLNRLIRTTDECDDDYFIFALIYSRYCPELLNFKFEGGRKLNEETIKHAKKLNQKYPFIKKDFEFLSKPENKRKKINTENNSFNTRDFQDLMVDAFSSDKFQIEFEKYFNKKTYYAIQTQIAENKYSPLGAIIESIACMRILRDINKDFSYSNDVDWLKSFIGDKKEEELMSKYVHSLLLKYATTRIDLKNCGKNNDIQIINNSDSFANEIYPKWFNNDEGRGLCIESYKGYIDLKVKCINDGKLKIWLRTKDNKDKNQKQYPIYIDYTSFNVNGKEYIAKKQLGNDYIDTHKIVGINDSYYIEIDVRDSDILKIHAEWIPFSKKCEYPNKLQNEIDNLKKENMELNKKLDEFNKIKEEKTNSKKSWNPFKKFKKI